jgi:hypothetical protein
VNPNGSLGVRSSRPRTRDVTHCVIYTRIVQVVEQIETLSHEIETALLGNAKSQGQPNIKRPETRPDAGIAAGKVWPVGSIVPIIVQLCEGEQIERTPAVYIGRLVSGPNPARACCLLPRSGTLHTEPFVPLIKRRQSRFFRSFDPLPPRWPAPGASQRQARVDPSIAPLPARSLHRGRYPHPHRSAPT